LAKKRIHRLTDPDMAFQIQEMLQQKGSSVLIPWGDQTKGENWEKYVTKRNGNVVLVCWQEWTFVANRNGGALKLMAS
jgi:hypothetical protein